ncbi:MAG: hypothetical protein M3434_01935, partial [Gemmatimonadota bacterium]|nr:hypothetical protein [Gemmatimonadota bacterium]
MKRIPLVLLALGFLAAGSASAQLIQAETLPARPLSLSGPRIGMTMLAKGEALDSLRSHYERDVSGTITQIGWQFEQRFYADQTNGLAALSEIVVLVGGLEQNMFLPSLSWLAGLRTGQGFEVGAGPNLSLTGVGLTVAAGATLQVGRLNLPIHFAFVPSPRGSRTS